MKCEDIIKNYKRLIGENPAIWKEDINKSDEQIVDRTLTTDSILRQTLDISGIIENVLPISKAVLLEIPRQELDAEIEEEYRREFEDLIRAFESYTTKTR